MEKEVYRKNAYDMLYLISCLLNEQKPSADRLSDIDLSGLYSVAKSHTLLGITAYALENAGINDERFSVAKARAIRKIILMDEERGAIISELEKNKIWYMPLKGIIIKEYYPKIGMREMCDNDILCDSKKMDIVRKIMEGRGYKLKGFYNTGHDDAYMKPPVYNFEMHRMLLNSATSEPQIFKYYEKVAEKLHTAGESCQKFFSPEDNYIYLSAHEYKHFSNGGNRTQVTCR